MSAFDPVRAAGAEIAAAVRARQTTARAVAAGPSRPHRARWTAALGAFTAVTATRALAEADAVDADARARARTPVRWPACPTR